jgi:hypothetical protein
MYQVPNSPPEPKKDDKDSTSDKASLKSQGKRKSTNSEVIHEENEHEHDIQSSPLIKEQGSDRAHPPAAFGSGTGDKEKEWRHSKLGTKVRGMENEEDMIKQRAEMRGLIEKKTYIGLVSQLAGPIVPS